MKIRNYLFAALIAAATTCTVTSCMNGGDDSHTMISYFTVTGNNTSGYVLYQDGGGKMIPTLSSVSDLTNGKGFGDLERLQLAFKFSESDLDESKNTITGAELTSGESLLVVDPVLQGEAEALNMTDKDSIYAINNVSALWAYRGYMTIIYNGNYSWSEKKDGYLYPKTNFIYSMSDQKPNEVDLTLCHNERRPAKSNAAGAMNFTVSLRLPRLLAATPGNDSVRINIAAQGLEKPLVIKVAREDFNKGDWR